MTEQYTNTMEGFSVSGWFGQARKLPSPNQDARPSGCQVEVVIIHAISLPPGRFGGPDIEHFFLNKLAVDRHPSYAQISTLQVSAHFLIRRDGEMVQFVSVKDRAWHAGVSCCRGRESVNDFSIGIELEGTDQSHFTESQYGSLQCLLLNIQSCYPHMNGSCLYGHSDIAPGRKTDPGPCFDWARTRSMFTA